MANPVITDLDNDTVQYNEADPPVRLDFGSNSVLTDADPGSYNGGTLRISITGGEVAAEDEILVGIFQGVFTQNGTQVVYDDNGTLTVIGTIVQFGTNGNDLIINLGPESGAPSGTATTVDEVNRLLKAIEYGNTNIALPTGGTRTITWTLDDGNDGSTTATTFVEVTSLNDTPVITGPSGGTVAYQHASTSSAGVDSNQTTQTSGPAISANGQFVVFYSTADNLVSNDTNGVRDVFVKNLQDGTIERVSVSSSGEEGNAQSGNNVLSISADGRYVLFVSSASNLVPNDTNGASDIFLRDRQTGQTTRVSVGAGGEQANGPSGSSFLISNNGQFALFASDAILAAGDTGSSGIFLTDLYVKNLSTGAVSLASVNAAGEQGLNVGLSGEQHRAFFGRSDMSDDGRYVVFESDADNMVPGYDQGPRSGNSTDIFLKDMVTGEVTLVSERNSGGASHDDSFIVGGGSRDPNMSADGRYVVFESNSNDLVANDNGNIQSDVFLWDRDAPAGSKLTLISTNSSGVQANTGSVNPNISPNGRYVVFESSATNLVNHTVPNDRNVFIKDLLTGEVRFIGTTPGSTSDRASVTNDGVVAFTSSVDDVPSDIDGESDVYVARFTGSGSIPVFEDIASPVRGVSFEDVDSGAGNVTVTLTVPRGTLSATSFGGVAVSGSATSLVLAGTVANINTFLGQDRLLYTTVLNDTADVSLGVAIDDGGNTGQDPGTSPGANSESATRTFTLDVIPVNDPPTVANNGLAVGPGAGAPIQPANLDADDIDNTDAQLVYTITQATVNGTLFKNGVAISAGGSFTQADINNNLVSYVHNGNGTTSDQFGFALRDNVEGPAINQAFLITIGAQEAPGVNDAPVNSVPGPREFEANVPTAITGLSITDDSGAGIITTTLSLQFGVLAIAPIAGAVVAGSGTDTVTLTGTLAQINATFAANNVVYSAPLDFFGGDTLTMHTNDNGNTGIGGPLTDTDQVAINLNTYLLGTLGPDSFRALPGNSHVDALTGHDTITFDFALTDAVVSYSGYRVIIEGPSSRTVLSGFETFVFTDGTVQNADGDRLVDDLFYYSRNHDVWLAQADADQHYHQHGWSEGRDPNAFFSTALYRATNPGVADTDPLTHFATTGWKEGRVPSPLFDPGQYLAVYTDVAAAGLNPLEHFLAHGAEERRHPFAASTPFASNGFDYAYYLLHNPDVAAAGIDPFHHFQEFGWREGRKPNALFDVTGYLANYSDVAGAGINPLDHYHQFGWREGRDPSTGFDSSAYLAAYADIAAANIDPLAHYLQFGMHEGRSSFADGLWG